MTTAISIDFDPWKICSYHLLTNLTSYALVYHRWGKEFDQGFLSNMLEFESTPKFRTPHYDSEQPRIKM